MKRMHKKSRLGCSTCKRRRIKCDEKPPCCGPCRKKGLECEYRDISLTAESFELLTPSDFSKGTPSSRGPSQGSKSGSREPPGSSDAGAFTLNDLALMSHWTLVTSRTMGVIDHERYHTIWQSQVPRLAQAYPFLMHALLSTAALHMSIVEPEPSFPGGDRGQYHYSKALGLFSETVTEVDVQNARLSEAIWCFSVLVMHISFVMGRVNSLSGQDIIESFASVLSSVRSARDVLAPLRTSPHDSLVRDLMTHTRQRPTHSLPTEVSHSLRRVEDSIKDQSNGFDQQTLAVLENAVASTRHFFTLVSPQPVDWAHILQWPFSLDRDFFSLLLERNPIALSLLAHWCVPVCNAPKRWSVGDWPRIVMDEIHASLEGTSWFGTIEWPGREITA